MYILTATILWKPTYVRGQIVNAECVIIVLGTLVYTKVYT